MSLELNVNPYFDDFDETKDYHQILFNPGKAVQARELTQIQSLLQEQVNRHGEFVFKDGSVVTGGQLSVELQYSFVKLQPTFGGPAIDVSTFIGKTLTGVTSGAKAVVLNSVGIENGDPDTIFVKYITGGASSTADVFEGGENLNDGSNDIATTQIDQTATVTFSGGTPTRQATGTPVIVDGEIIQVEITDSGEGYTSAPTINIAAGAGGGSGAVATTDIFEGKLDKVIFSNNGSGYRDSATGNGSSINITEGIFFVDGFFIRKAEETIILDKYSSQPSYRIGVETQQSIVTAGDDISLNDVAQDTPNFNAPGADRLKQTLSLSKRSLTSTDDDNFFEVIRIVGGILDIEINQPVLNDIEKILARRTYDESGSYTVRPFSIRLTDNSDTTKFTAAIGAGKGFIEGFEFETINTTQVAVDKARDFDRVSGETVTASWGNYVIVENLAGNFDIDTMATVDLHDIPANNAQVDAGGSDGVSTVSTGNFNSTAGDFVVNGVRAGDILDITGGTGGGDNGRYRVVSVTDGDNLVVTPNFPVGDTAVVYTVERKIILTNSTTYNETKLGTARVRSVRYDSGLVAGPYKYKMYLFDIQMDANKLFRNVESIVASTSGTPYVLNAECDIDLLGKFDVTDEFSDTVLKDTGINELLFPVSQQVCRNFLQSDDTTSDTTYKFQRVFENFQFTSSAATITSDDGTERFHGGNPVNDSVKASDWHIVVSDPESSGLTDNQVLFFDDASSGSIVVNGAAPAVADTATLTYGTPALTFKADIYAPINKNTAPARVKTLVTNFKKAITNPNPFPGTTISCELSDLSTIKAIYDSGTPATPASAPNVVFSSSSGTFTVGETVSAPGGKTGEVISWSPETLEIITTSTFVNGDVVTGSSSGASGTVNTFSAGDTEILSDYTFDTGQKDNFYDHAKITLNQGATIAAGDILIICDYFTHTGKGFCSVDSYTNINYEDIPIYVNNNGKEIALRDVFDFRPRRDDGAGVTTLSGIEIPVPNDSMTLDYSFYLNRIDLIYISRDKFIGVTKGVSAIDAFEPDQDEGSMPIYRLNIPAYTFDTKDILIFPFKNKRYTMRDIGRLEDRIKNLEYYTTLSLLEKDTTDLVIVDTDGNERFKNGILAEPFRGHAIGRVTDTDYACSIDFEKQELRPSFVSDHVGITYNPTHADTTGVQLTGDVITLPYTSTDWLRQDVFSGDISVNPFDISSWIGEINLVPSSDIWIDTTKAPDLIVNEAEANDAFQAALLELSNNVGGFGTKWNEWETNWTGSALVSRRNFVTRTGSTNHNDEGNYQYYTTKTFDQTGSKTRTGLTSSFITEETSEILGSKIIDTSVIPFMRSKTITIDGTGLRPFTRVYPFFDGVDVSIYCTPDGGVAGDPIETDVTGAFTNLQFTIPATSTQRFRTGILKFLVTEISTGDLTKSLTYAQDTYTARGTIETVQKSLNVTRTPKLVTTPRSETQNVSERVTKTNRYLAIQRDGRGGNRTYFQSSAAYQDPVAQTFQVVDTLYPSGLFLTSCGIRFTSKSDESIPIRLEIRTTLNGFPTQTVVPFASVTLDASSVTADATGGTITTFTFPSLVQLPPGEYAIVLISNDTDYRVMVSEIGELQIGTTKTISKQPFLGSFFKSQNASTWTPDQAKDLAFVLKQAVFDISSTATAVFENDNVASEIRFDTGQVQGQELIVTGTGIDWDYKSTTRTGVDTGTADANYNSFIINDNINFGSQQVITTDTVSPKALQCRATLTSNDTNYSPLIDVERSGFIAVENIINNVSTNEENASGGDATARYITRRVTLKEGFDATDLNVFVTANRQPGTNIKVYYKVMSAEDPDRFDEKSWVEMTQIGGTNLFSNNERSFIEYEYEPPTTPITYDSGRYDSFKYFAFKIVMLSSNTSIIPKCSDLRGIAIA